MDAISKYHDSKITHGQYISILFFSFIYIVCILTLESNLFFYFFVLDFKGTTKEAFVVDVIQLALDHCQLITHHHVAKAKEATTKYRT
jgi:hypothetical protein